MSLNLYVGGQNVNKLNTKAELRFHVYSADWLSDDVKGRLHAQQANKINNEGELLVTSQEHRFAFQFFTLQFFTFMYRSICDLFVLK